MVLNKVYLTFDGEVNAFGIGTPTIFLRLGGCHLRCYKLTMGTLCDTPEALNRTGQVHTEVSTIFEDVKRMSDATGVKKVTLTGGDPLWNREDELKELFTLLTEYGLDVTVETSGTISWLPYKDISTQIFWVLDYKLQSTGVKNPAELFFDEEHLQSLRPTDYIKLVVYDEDDFREAVTAIKYLFAQTDAMIAIGAYWGGRFTTFQLFEKLRLAGVLGMVQVNMQTHKLVVSANFGTEIPTDI